MVRYKGKGSSSRSAASAEGPGWAKWKRRQAKREKRRFDSLASDVETTEPVGRCTCGGWLYEGRDHKCFS